MDVVEKVFKEVAEEIGVKFIGPDMIGKISWDGYNYRAFRPFGYSMSDHEVLLNTSFYKNFIINRIYLGLDRNNFSIRCIPKGRWEYISYGYRNLNLHMLVKLKNTIELEEELNEHRSS